MARDPGAIVAYCSFWRIFDEVHVNNFAVHPAWRRQRRRPGAARPRAAGGGGLGAPRATLEVRASNPPRSRLYEAGGFVRAGVRPAYYTIPSKTPSSCGAAQRPALLRRP